ncbi:hypothetical protein [Aminobacter sp. AP02]|uniref:hypothetical protein n=1 Tax=Aminobacter sp. AP02 TaxID=2135737 RepID=UPI000D79ED14|nr:hypothetical protein [Aminobacter sp. AP02]PWK63173.1 hypothetical protein C8K44_12738 [Aminobacter sp. AP02]
MVLWKYTHSNDVMNIISEGEVRMNRIAKIVAGVAIIVGAVWMLQGAGWLGGSFMTGRTEWFWIGIVTALGGCVALWWLRQTRRG